MIDTKATGANIRKLCEEHSISVAQIQQRLNIGAFQSVYNWFSGKTLPSLENFYELSKMLYTPMNQIIIEVDQGKVIDRKMDTKDIKILLIDNLLTENRMKRLSYYISFSAQ